MILALPGHFQFCRMAAVKGLPKHRYGVVIFKISVSLELLDSDILSDCRIPLKLRLDA